VASFKAGRTDEVIPPREAALTGEPAGARAAKIHYYLGAAYAKTEIDKAIAHLQAAVAGDVDQDDARFQLASVLDRSGAYAQARAEYDRFATAHPQSQFAVFAMRRSATLARLPAGAQPRENPLSGAALPPAAAPPLPGAPSEGARGRPRPAWKPLSPRKSASARPPVASGPANPAETPLAPPDPPVTDPAPPPGEPATPAAPAAEPTPAEP
jgi:tetratricopeptide (TPR) repeat protein